MNFGAEGIGLCRTEHMFFEADRIPAVREMIVAKNKERERHLLSFFQCKEKTLLVFIKK
jgi:pyruvate, orthophosphate dikinase